jgi:hypothetical protein
MVFLIDPGVLSGKNCPKFDPCPELVLCPEKLCGPRYIPLYGIDPEPQ